MVGVECQSDVMYLPCVGKEERNNTCIIHLHMKRKIVCCVLKAQHVETFNTHLLVEDVETITCWCVIED